MPFCHAIKILDGVKNTRLFCGKGAGFDTENKSAFEKEFSKLAGIFAAERSRSLDMTLLGWKCSSWSSSRLTKCLKRWKKAKNEGLIVGPNSRIDSSGNWWNGSGNWWNGSDWVDDLRNR
jgi:hypothetical protein